MVTRSEVIPLGQGPLFKVHWNTFGPMAKPLTAEEGDDGDAIVPDPLTKVHWPVAGAIGALPASVAVGEHTC